MTTTFTKADMITLLMADLETAAAMLRLDAQEWRSRKAPDHMGRTREQMLDIAASNEG